MGSVVWDIAAQYATAHDGRGEARVMEYVRLGSTGLQVSPICLGMMTYGSSQWRSWVLDEHDARPFVARALELGINFFDTADMYSNGISEEVTGRLLADHAEREDVVIATKVFFNWRNKPNRGGLSRRHIMASIDDSLRRLDTEYVDLYQIHRWDPDTPVEETMEALHDVVKAGKVRYIGASSMWAWQFAKAQHVAAVRGWTPFVTMQDHYNLLYREEEREMLPLCSDQQVGVLPWSPLARGLLAAGVDRATTRAGSDTVADRLYPDVSAEIIAAVAAVARRHGCSPAQVALAWLLRQPVVTAPIIGASRIEHLEQAVGALDVTLTDDDVVELTAPYRPQEVREHG
jgi:aryl-alcohol dehydrogenase-like predicted oxidoreductase